MGEGHSFPSSLFFSLGEKNQEIIRVGKYCDSRSVYII